MSSNILYIIILASAYMRGVVDTIGIFTPQGSHDFEVPQIPAEEIVSTVGAGDSFNAGFLCALHQQGIHHNDLPNLPLHTWQSLVANGIRYSSQVCRSQYNYIEKR